jgi:anti-repressor protein
MEELIKVSGNEGRQTVLGRDLHEFLGVESNYTTWFNRMCEYGFEKGADFIPLLEESTGGRPEVNHQLTLSMAKEISMIQR